jgi:hypothetical protein
MTDSRMALGMDRLPWLPDDEPARSSPPPRTPARRPMDLLGWAVAAIVIVAAVSYWLGTRTRVEDEAASSAPAVPPSTTLTLPEPRRIEPHVEAPVVDSPEVKPVELPAVRPAPSARRLPRTVPDAVAERVRRTVAREEHDRVAKAQASAKPAVPNTQNVRIWSPWESAGATGRVVQIGAFGSRQQAKLGWRHMVRAYPAVRRLQAVVVEARNSRGRRFYRFQIGTTSQAHSEVLCQRMQKIAFSCAVVGLPGAKKAVER